MSVAVPSSKQAPPFLVSLRVQARVIGALILRELHTRYGRENIGYAWLFAEPMLLASVMGLLHHSGHTAYGSDIRPLPFTIVGYTTYIMFRQIVNRSDGALEGNAPLLYHRMVTVFDIALSRSLLEGAGTFSVYAFLMLLLTIVGLADVPARPLALLVGVVFMFWYSWSHAMVIMAMTYENRTVGRLVHPYSYFMIPLSGAFFQVDWLPEPYRTLIMWVPLPHVFELVRYGQFQSATLKHFSAEYLIGWCLVLTWLGLVSMRICRRKMHLQ